MRGRTIAEMGGFLTPVFLGAQGPVVTRTGLKMFPLSNLRGRTLSWIGWTLLLLKELFNASTV